MDKTFLTIMGSVIIAWTLATINDSQEIKTAEFTLDNQSTIVQEVKWRLPIRQTTLQLNLVTTMPKGVNVPVGRIVTVTKNEIKRFE